MYEVDDVVGSVEPIEMSAVRRDVEGGVRQTGCEVLPKFLRAEGIVAAVDHERGVADGCEVLWAQHHSGLEAVAAENATNEVSFVFESISKPGFGRLHVDELVGNDSSVETLLVS